MKLMLGEPEYLIQFCFTVFPLNDLPTIFALDPTYPKLNQLGST